MNLFCFSLEGSMDSLYEPVKENQEPQEAICMTSRANTPVNVPVKYGPPERSQSLEFSDIEGTLMKKRKSIQKSMSENEAFDRKTVNGIIGQLPKKQENDLYFGRHCQSEEMNEDFLIGERLHLLQGTRIEETTCQVMTLEQWIPHQSHDNHDASSDMVADADENKAETMGTLKQLQKLVRTKKASVHSLEDIKHVLAPLNPPPQHACPSEDEDEVLTSCMKLTKSQDKKVLKENTRQKEESKTRTDVISASLGRSYTSRLSNLGNISIRSETEFQLWSDWKPFPDNQLCPRDFLITRIEEWEQCTCSHQPRLSCSLTNVDLPFSWRASSFGNFDHNRHPSSSKPDDSSEICEVEAASDGGEPGQNKITNGGSLGKKMRAISMTMKKKMGKKYIKALSEEMNEEGKEDSGSNRDSDPGGGANTEKASLKASDSMDSLYSGQSSSSGVTSCSDGTSNRDSLRLDDEVPYTGPFCGRARVHTDFTPSPYDTDSLKIKKGDIIDIICKTPMGMWTGLLNNKVGNFKFIYVDLIEEEESTSRKIKPHKRSKRAKPKSLQELLERIHLQDYISTLLLNGYEKLEDLKDLKESHLIELKIENQEDRMRLLSAIESLQDYENEQDQDAEQVPQTLSSDLGFNKSQSSDCPRDSGCYTSSENSDNSKDDPDTENLSALVHAITITESN
ncbi:SAM domain-containing protein SAMSN-1 isoform X1 [Heteronotia binoei]|uniref:SAM domain-containing protein SAMSN-1 isoform X1 n=1 Tax=Heteronotia binoei TaxID=13085 RepID=UPI00292F01A6|nr:SAM domain-containing protein SAMSN-1 isoform X1 [Heteronotia binoei]